VRIISTARLSFLNLGWDNSSSSKNYSTGTL